MPRTSRVQQQQHARSSQTDAISTTDRPTPATADSRPSRAGRAGASRRTSLKARQGKARLASRRRLLLRAVLVTVNEGRPRRAREARRTDSFVRSDRPTDAASSRAANAPTENSRYRRKRRFCAKMSVRRKACMELRGRGPHYRNKRAEGAHLCASPGTAGLPHPLRGARGSRLNGAA
jgi:hypothetical protein